MAVPRQRKTPVERPPGFDPQRKNLPVVIVRLAHIAHARDFLQFFHAVIRSDFRFQHHAAGRPNLAEQIFRRVARFDPPFVDNDHAAAGHLDFGQNVGRKQDRVLFARDS